jgi:hypothetical protein
MKQIFMIENNIFKNGIKDIQTKPDSIEKRKDNKFMLINKYLEIKKSIKLKLDQAMKMKF